MSDLGRLWLDPLELVLEKDGVSVIVWRTNGKGLTLTPQEFTNRVAASAHMTSDEALDLIENCVERMSARGRALILDEVQPSIISAMSGKYAGTGRGDRFANHFLAVLKDLVAEDDELNPNKIAKRKVITSQNYYESWDD